MKAADCVAQFGQLQDLKVVGPLSDRSAGGMIPKPNITGIAACAQACAADSDCQFLIFDHGASQEETSLQCQIRVSRTANQPASNITLLLAFKQIPAGNTVAAGSKAKSIGTGKFTFWNDSTADQVDGYEPDPLATSSDTCLDSCTIDPTCYAVLIRRFKSTGDFLGCGLIKSAFKQETGSVRTLLRAIPQRTTP
eukprot:gene3349-3625_t